MCTSLQGRVAIIDREPLYSSKFTALHAELTDDNTLPGTPATGILKFFILKGPVTFNRWNGIFSMYKLLVLVKLSVGLLWLKLHSIRRGLFLLAHWTWN